MQERMLLYKRYNTQSDNKSLRKRLQESVEQIACDDESYSIGDSQQANNAQYNDDMNQPDNRHHPYFIHSSQDYLLQDISLPFPSQIHLSRQVVKSHYTTSSYSNVNQMFLNNNDQYYLSYKVRNLMKTLKELIKELSLTKNSSNQVDNELEKVVGEFQETLLGKGNGNGRCQQQQQQRGVMNYNNTNNRRQLDSLSQIRTRTVYQIFSQPSLTTLTDSSQSSLKLFNSFLIGTSYQSQQSQNQTRLTTLQQQLLSQYLQRYMFLLQKQISRISRYNGERKLKYLLSTVMKQIFTHLMRFTYETKMVLARRQGNKLLTNDSLKTNIFISTLERILNTNILLSSSFSKIKHFIINQQKSDIKLIKKFQSKINYLDNLMKVRNRTQLRQKFLKWRRNVIVLKQTEKVFVVNGIANLGKEILYEFAINEGNLERWKFIVWGRLNQFVKSICNAGECVLFPVDQSLLSPTNPTPLSSQLISQTTTNLHSSPQTHRQFACHNTYRYSESSSPNINSDEDVTFITQKRLLDCVHETFSLQQIRQCLLNGEIVMHDIDVNKIILIPLKVIGAIIVVKYHIQGYSSNKNNLSQSIISDYQKQSPLMNVNSFYNILNAIQVSEPMILELMTLKEKFQYFSSRIQEKSHHKYILNHLLTPLSKKLNQSIDNNSKHDMHNRHIDIKAGNNLPETISHFISIQQQSNLTNKQSSRNIDIDYEQVDNLLMRMNVKRVLMYHKRGTHHQQQPCLNYTTNCTSSSLQKTSIIGADIVDAIFTQLERINNNFLATDNSSQLQSKCLYLRKSVLSFYACPIIEKGQVIGFIEIHLEKELVSQISNCNGENNFIVKTIDSKSQILTETIVFVADVVLPMIIKLKLQVNNNQSTRQNSVDHCQVCSSSIKFSLQSHLYRQQNIEMKYCNSQKYRLQLNHINDLFIQIATQFNFYENKKYEVEKLFLNEIKKYYHSIEQPLAQNYHHEEEIRLIKQQFFTKIFYLTIPRTKDNKPFLPKSNKSEKTTNSANFYHTPPSQPHLQKLINLSFIDMLRLFNHKTNKPIEFQPQKIQISISKLNEIYKSMLRRMRSNKSTSTESNSSLQQQNQQNCLENFIEEILKSTLLREDVLNLQEDKKFHALELWLYQLEHINKKYGNDKFCFVVSVFPVFSSFGSRNKFLSAIVCSAGVIITNETISQRSHNSRNQFLYNLHQFSFSLGQQLLSRVLELHFTKQPSQKVDLKNLQQKMPLQQLKLSDIKSELNLKQLSMVEITRQKLYNKTQQEIHRIVSNVSQLQNLINHSIKVNAKSAIISKFYPNFKLQKFQILKQFVSTIEKKIFIKNLTTKSDIFSFFISKIVQQNLMKSRHYLTNAINFMQKMSNVFIRNKMLKPSFRMLKSVTFEASQEVLDKLFEPGLIITKKFALQRMETMLSKKLYQKTSQDSVLYSCFSILRSFSNHRRQISTYEKQMAIINLTSTVQKLICTKSYLPYFKNLQYLEKSLYQSLSLIGTEIKTVNFYSIHQFLRFLDQRISIIINGEKRLIQILYDSFINKINVSLVIQNLQNNRFSQFSLGHDYQHQELHFEQIEKQIKQIRIFMTQRDMTKFYFSLQFINTQSSEENKNTNDNLKDLKRFIQKIFENHVSFVFEKFIMFYQRKMHTFVLKLLKFFKIPVHFSKKNRSIQSQDHYLKKDALKKLKTYFQKQVKSKKIAALEELIEVKSAQLSKLHDFYDKRAKKLTSSGLMQNRIEINVNESIKEQNLDNIVSKKCLKKLRKDIENLDMNNENLSIQYQIKSKTVAGHQMMEIISTKERKQAMKEVFLNLSVIMNEDSTTNWYSTNRLFLNGTGKQHMWSTISRRFPEQTVQEVIVEEKQRLNYSRASYMQEKNLYDNKFKKAGAKAITKALKNIYQKSFRGSVYQINFYMKANSPKFIR